MGDKTGIEWTDATWNPIVGCSIHSPGCSNCYAMAMAARIERMDTKAKLKHYKGLTTPSKAGPVWTGRVAEAAANTMLQPLRWARPRKVFVNSMSDLFHEGVPDETIDRIFAVMALTPQHTYQVLTKRARRMREWATTPLRKRKVAEQVMWISMAGAQLAGGKHGMVKMDHFDKCFTPNDGPFPNIWFGVSAERELEAYERIPDLLGTPAAKRFVSLEPLLGPIDLQVLLDINAFLAERIDLDWVIAGGESGPRARPMHPDWVRGLRDQCAAAGVPFFFKQWGEWAPSTPAAAGTNPHCGWVPIRAKVGHPVREEELYEAAGAAFVERFGKHVAGAELDGVEHKAWPAS